jgi:Flp pilus assembly protein TadD
VLAGVVALFYLPALSGEFINWDDPAYVTNNADIRRLDWRTVRWAFTTFHTGNWHPLTWISLALDHQLYGLRPFGYHATSLALHVANTVLVLLVLHRLTGAVWQSAAVAALFGLHPQHVESVAWVAERKDVLSAFFWLVTMLAYVRYVEAPAWRRYLLVVLAFALALLSKPMAITLPFALLLLDYWPLGRLSWKAVQEKVPLLVLAAGLSVSTFVAQSARGAVAIDPIPLGARVANAIVSCAQYVALTVWPVGLSPWYSHPALEGPPLSMWRLAGAVVFLVGVTALVLATARRRPWAAIGWLWFLGTLVPVIGLVQVGRQAMADRYVYIPHIGLFVAVVWTLAELPLWRRSTVRSAAAAVTGLVLVTLGVLTFRQTRIWHDSLGFWTYTAKMAPYSFVAHQARGGLLLYQQRIDEALPEYRLAVHLRPDHPEVRARLAGLLARKGELGAAGAQYRKAVALRPNEAQYHQSLADVLHRRGRPVAARRHVERALTLRPGFAEAHNTRGRLFLAEGRLAEAAADFRAALRAKPGFAEAQRNLRIALEGQGTTAVP